MTSGCTLEYFDRNVFDRFMINRENRREHTCLNILCPVFKNKYKSIITAREWGVNV